MAVRGPLQPKPVAAVVDKVIIKQQRQELTDKVFQAELQGLTAQTAIQVVEVAEQVVQAVRGPHNSLVMVVLDEVQQLQELGDSTVVEVVVAYTGQVQMQDLVAVDLVVVATVTALQDLIQEHKMVNLIQAVAAGLAEIPVVQYRMEAAAEAEL
jgi:hypothetical protein